MTDTILAQAQQFARSMDVDAETIVWWLQEMRVRVKDELGDNDNPTDEEFAVALGGAMTKLSTLLRELAEGKSFRAQVARKFITLSAYYGLRGEENANERAAEETAQTFAAVDLEAEARRSLASLGL